jgi:hypothetical protein
MGFTRKLGDPKFLRIEILFIKGHLEKLLSDEQEQRGDTLRRKDRLY